MLAYKREKMGVGGEGEEMKVVHEKTKQTEKRDKGNWTRKTSKERRKERTGSVWRISRQG